MSIGTILARVSATAVLSAVAFSAPATSLNIVGSANNIPLPTVCTPSGNVQIALPTPQNPGLNVTFACNGIAFACELGALPQSQGLISQLSVRNSPSASPTLNLRCKPGANITGAQHAITQWYPSLAAWNAGQPQLPEPSFTQCFGAGAVGRILQPSPSYSVGSRLYSFVCGNRSQPANPVAKGCYLLDSTFNWDSLSQVLLPLVCIEAANDATAGTPADPNNPFLFSDDFEPDVLRVPQAITFGQPATQTFAPSGSFDLVASSSSGLPVSIATNTPERCTVFRNIATIISAGTGPSACSLTASQPGNSEFSPANSVTRTVNINKAQQSITFNPPANVSLSAQTASWPAPTGGGSGNPVFVGVQPPSVCTLASSQPHTVNLVGAGTCSLVANQFGDDNYEPTSAFRSIIVDR